MPLIPLSASVRYVRVTASPTCGISSGPMTTRFGTRHVHGGTTQALFFSSSPSVSLSASLPPSSFSVRVGPSRFLCAEALFQSGFTGIGVSGFQDNSLRSHMQCDVYTRKELYAKFRLPWIGEAYVDNNIWYTQEISRWFGYWSQRIPRQFSPEPHAV